jgi:hypothetical protein
MTPMLAAGIRSCEENLKDKFASVMGSGWYREATSPSLS